MAHELEVWLFANQVGTLSLVDGRLSFAYHPSWLANPDAVVLSCSLPLQAAPFNERGPEMGRALAAAESRAAEPAR